MKDNKFVYYIFHTTLLKTNPKHNLFFEQLDEPVSLNANISKIFLKNRYLQTFLDHPINSVSEN